MAQKRNLNHFFESEDSGSVPVGKKAKVADPFLPPDSSMEISQSELEALSHGELVAHAISLQQTLQKTLTALESEQDKSKTLLKEASKKSALVPKSANNVAAAQTMSPAQVAERAEKLADMCARGIKKQMKWQPSCKSGSTRWSFSGVSPTPEILFKMLDLPSDGKPWKMKKIAREDFCNTIGDVEASVRYNTLRITSAQINVKWNPETNEFSMSGTYGI